MTMYAVKDTDPGITYEAGEEVIGTLQADNADAAIMAVLRREIPNINDLYVSNPGEFEKYVLQHIVAVKV